VEVFISHRQWTMVHRLKTIDNKMTNLQTQNSTFAPMIIEILKSKIHRVKVTQAELNYVGSITIDEDLIEAANLIPNEKVQIVNNNNGARFETYVIKGERGTGIICLNGAAARLAQVGDIVIIMSYAWMEHEEARKYEPVLVFPGPDNKLIK